MVIFGILNVIAASFSAFSAILCVKGKMWPWLITNTTLGLANVCLAIQNLIG